MLNSRNCSLVSRVSFSRALCRALGDSAHVSGVQACCCASRWRRVTIATTRCSHSSTTSPALITHLCQSTSRETPLGHASAPRRLPLCPFCLGAATRQSATGRHCRACWAYVGCLRRCSSARVDAVAGSRVVEEEVYTSRRCSCSSCSLMRASIRRPSGTRARERATQGLPRRTATPWL